MMKFKEDYKELLECFISFKRNHYFEKFNSGDIFCINEQKKTNLVLMTFIDQFFGDALGLQLFYTKDGINYVHDVLSCADEGTVTIGDCDSIVSVLKKKNELTKEDLAFLKLVDQKVVRDNNLILYRFTKGLKSRVCTKSEVSTMALYGVFLASLIPNEHKDIKECFKNGDSVLVDLDVEAKRYQSYYGPLPLLQMNLTSKPINQPFVDEYKNSTYLNEDCYLYTSYLPVTIKESGVRPLLLYFYFANSGKMELKYIIDEPKEYKNDIYGILDDIFTNVGLPAKMVINNRDLYYILHKTLGALNIENTFERDNKETNKDYVSLVVSKMYEKTQDSEMESQETVTMLIDLISSALSSIDDTYLEEDSNKGDFVS